MKHSILAFLFFLNITCVNAVEHLFVLSGVVVNSDSSQKTEQFIQMLSDKSGYKFKPYYVSSYEQLSQTLRTHPDAFAWTCGAPFAEDHVRDGQQIVAVPLFMGLPTYHSVVITRKASKGKKLEDFKNKVFAYSDRRSNSGYLAAAVKLKKMSTSISDFFRISIDAGNHEKSMEAVYRGLADIAFIDEYVWVEYLKSKPDMRKTLHVIEKLGPFPFTPIVAGKSVSKKVLKSVRNTLLNLNTAELTSFKRDFNMDGFVEKKSSFYDSIKHDLSLTGMKF